MSPRRYDLGRRKLAIQATRVRIVEAARELIGGSEDLNDFTIETIAKRAGVARMTVFNQFGSRSGLLEALADHLAVSGGLRNPRSAFETTTPQAAAEVFIQTFVRFWAHDRRTMRRLRAMGVVFPSHARGPRARDRWRREHLSVLLARFRLPRKAAGAKARREALDLLMLLTSFEAFDALCTNDRSPQRVGRLLSRIALEELGIGDSETRGSTGTSR